MFTSFNLVKISVLLWNIWHQNLLVLGRVFSRVFSRVFKGGFTQKNPPGYFWVRARVSEPWASRQEKWKRFETVLISQGRIQKVRL